MYTNYWPHVFVARKTFSESLIGGLFNKFTHLALMKNHEIVKDWKCCSSWRAELSPAAPQSPPMTPPAHAWNDNDRRSGGDLHGINWRCAGSTSYLHSKLNLYDQGSAAILWDCESQTLTWSQECDNAVKTVKSASKQSILADFACVLNMQQLIADDSNEGRGGDLQWGTMNERFLLSKERPTKPWFILPNVLFHRRLRTPRRTSPYPSKVYYISFICTICLKSSAVLFQTVFHAGWKATENHIKRVELVGNKNTGLMIYCDRI